MPALYCGRSVRLPSILGAVALALGATGCKRQQAASNLAAGAETDELVSLEWRAVRQDDRAATMVGAPGETSLSRPAVPEAPELAAETAHLLPGAEWRSEALSIAAQNQLQRALRGEFDDLTASDFACTDLRPEALSTRDYRGGITVRRIDPGQAPPELHGDPAALSRGIAALRSLFPERAMAASVKIVGIELAGDGFSTTAFVELREAARTGPGGVQVSAVWEAHWTDTSPPRLRSLRVRGHEEAAIAPPDEENNPRAGFVDVTPGVLGATPHFDALVETDVATWASRLTRLGDFSLSGHHGLAVGDVNGDGRDDLFVCDGGSLPNRLYVQQPDGSARDESARAGLDWFEDSRSALLVDLDNDGDQDLVVATIAMIAFAENDGSGVFTLRGGHPGAPYPFSLSAADFDNDGDLDIYACVYSSADTPAARGFEAQSPRPFHDAENGGRNLLLANLGNFRFADVTARVGLDRDNTRWSFAAAWEDYDRDGDPDLYVANDFGRNCLYRNDGGHFVQIAAEAGVEDMASGMSVAWGDYDRDGRADLYVGNMFSSAGHRISYQRAFAEPGDAGTVQGLRRMARGNSLFAAHPDGRFRDVSEASGAHLGRWAWSSGFVDINNDGWDDLAASNGFLTGRRPDDL